MEITTSEVPTTEDPCKYVAPAYLTERFILVTGIGSTVALISIVGNGFLCYLLLRRYSFRSSPMLYLGLLAVCDIFISSSYIPLMSLNLLADVMESPLLLNAWFNYMAPLITVSHIAMTAQSFLIVAATFERYQLTVAPRSSSYFNRRRPFIAIGSILVGFVTKISMAAELATTPNPNCTGRMTENSLSLSTLGQDPIYNGLWRFFARTMITVYIPFFCLAFLNARIVCVIQKSEYIEQLEETGSKRKNRVKEATRTLIIIVCVYLMSNVLNVVVTIWEYIDMSSLVEYYSGFYLFSVDLVSLLTVFACSLRLPIYLTCQSQLRREIVSFCSGFSKSKDRINDSTIITHTTKMEKDDDSSTSNLLTPPSPSNNNNYV